MTILKELRKARGYTQDKLSKLLGVSRSTVSMWEISASEPDNETAIRIAKLFDVTTDYLLGRTDDPAPPHEKSPVYDDEALELMEEMHKRPEMKVLFKTSLKATREDIEAVNQLIQHMVRGEEDDV